MKIQELSAKTGLNRWTIAAYYKNCLLSEGDSFNWKADFSEQDLKQLITIRQLRMVNFEFEVIRQMLESGTVQEGIRSRILKYSKTPRQHRYELELLKRLQSTEETTEEKTTKEDITERAAMAARKTYDREDRSPFSPIRQSESGQAQQTPLQVKDRETRRMNRFSRSEDDMLFRRVLRKKQAEDYLVRQDYFYFAFFNLLVFLGVIAYELITISMYGLSWGLYFGTHYWWVLLILMLVVNAYGVHCRRKRIEELHSRVFPRQRTALEAMVELGGNYFTYTFFAFLIKMLVQMMKTQHGIQTVVSDLVAVILMILILAVSAFLAGYPFYQKRLLRQEFAE